MAVLLGMMSCAVASAGSDVDELAADQIAVHELMRLETHQLLRQLRTAAGHRGTERPRMQAHTENGAVADVSATRLVAIYGVGSKLMAEVRVDDHTLLFTRGRPEPIGPGKAHAMRLLSISDRCVTVAWKDRQESLCASASAVSKG